MAGMTDGTLGITSCGWWPLPWEPEEFRLWTVSRKDRPTLIIGAPRGTPTEDVYLLAMKLAAED